MTNERSNFEAGDEELVVERRPRAEAVISVRLSTEEASRLQSLAESEHKSVSRFARDVLTTYLDRVVAERTVAGATMTTTAETHVRFGPLPVRTLSQARLPTRVSAG